MEKQELKLKEKLCAGVVPSEEGDEFRKVEKVLAPFMRSLQKRKHEKADVLPTAHEELYLKRNPKELIVRLQAVFSDPLELRTLMNETAELLKVVTKSRSVNLYFPDYDRGEILLCPKYYQHHQRLQRRYIIGTYLAAHVAFTKEYVISSDILGDVRFPQGIPDVPTVKSVICLPIITNVKEKCIGVIELYRECSEKPYDLVNLQICNALTAWMGIAVEENANRRSVVKQLEIQNALSQLSELYFSGMIPFNKIISDFLEVFKSTVKAEKGAFYVFRDPVPSNSESTLFADAYEEGTDDANEVVLYKKNAQARFAKNGPGIPGHAARTGNIVKVHDAYKDPRFDRKTDSAFYRTRSVVAFPVKSDNGVLAVVNLINCMSYPYFREEDISLVESFLYQITLVCEYYFLTNDNTKTQLKLLVVERLLDYHTKPPVEEMNELRAYIQGEPQPPSGLWKFDWDLTSYEEEFSKYSAYIFLCPDILEPCFDVQNLVDFVLRVKKSYRPTLYHNFEHAFSVQHFAFNVIQKNKDVYGAAEIVSILLAALCHDVDHWGLTNTFLTLQNDAIYSLYGDVCGEAHRYELILFLIQQTDLLSNVSAQNYKFICTSLKKLMFAFDVAICFQNRLKITELLNKNGFSWEDPEHRFLSQNMVLICSDYYLGFKSFEVVKKMTSTFYKELYRQGDLEKSMGFSPLPMLDRNKIEMVPENQIILLSVVVQPVVEILVRLLPNLNILGKLLERTLQDYNEVLQFRGQAMWRIQDAIGKEKKERRYSYKNTISSTASSMKTILSESKSPKI